MRSIFTAMLMGGAMLLAVSPTNHARSQSVEELAVYALELAQEDMFRLTLERGARPNGVARGNSLLGHAIRQFRPAAVAELVRRGADVNLEAGNPPLPPLLQAWEAENLQALMFLISQGADVGVRRNQLAAAVINANEAALLPLVVPNGNANARVPSGDTLLGHAIAVCAERLRAGARAARDVRADQALSLYQGCVAIVDVLLSLGADVSLPAAEQRDPPLHAAASAGLWEVVIALLNRGADAQQRNRRGETPIVLAAAHSLATEHREVSMQRQAAKQAAMNRLLRAMLSQPAQQR